MKLLLDAQLSRRSLAALQSAFPGSDHAVVALDLANPSDEAIFYHARNDDFVLVTKDKDFVTLSRRHGRPPLIILLLTGNGSRQSVENLLLNNAEQMQAALADQSIAIFELR